MAKSQKNIQFKKIEFDAWNVVLYEVELIDIDNRLSKFMNQTDWMHKLVLKDFEIAKQTDLY